MTNISDISALLQQQTQQLREHPVPPYFAERELDINFGESDTDNQDEYETQSHHATPIGQYVQQVITQAISQKASDIHFEPYENTYRIRMRIDGLLITTHKPTKKLSRRLASRIKILSQLNIAERRLPQDGRLKIKLEQQTSVDIRVSTLPTLWGEKIVLRILGTSHCALPLTQLGLTKLQRDKLNKVLNQQQGLILVTGPTGSGKTTTLYSALHQLNQEQRNVSTVEDPIEIQLTGINQVQIHEQIGLGFAPILRSLLRQDPDVIMLGEIRDQETAQMAIRAAQTGHLVLSTLHTNSAPEALLRLQHMGTPLYQLMSSLKLVIAQRLVRKLCPDCKVSTQEPNFFTQLTHSGNEFSDTTYFKANQDGCQHCLSGYKGRVAVYDFFSLDECTLSDHLEQSALAFTQQRGCHLWQQGQALVQQGITSFSEIARVIDLPEQTIIPQYEPSETT